MTIKPTVSFVLLLIVWHVANGAPLESNRNSNNNPFYDPEETAGKDEGDMLLTEDQRHYLNTASLQRNGLLDESRRWPDNILWYRIVGEFDQSQLKAIANAIELLESRTCIRFREADETRTEYVEITSSPDGCYTAVGYQAKVQQMNLQPFPIGQGCFRAGTIHHEFMHALGFYHQQSAADRDEYIDVLYENIIPGKEFNFKKYDANVVGNFDVGYDYESCLHYRSLAFTKNGEPTIVPHDSQAEIGQRISISSKDIDKINVMYKCPIKI